MLAGPEPLCVESCYAAVTATNMLAVQVQLPQTQLLFKHAYWLRAAAR